MIQMQTTLAAADNSGARELMCIKVLGGSKRRYAQIGDVIKVSVREAIPRGKVKKGDVLEVLYTVDGFDPNDSGVAGDSHVHFFYSTVDPNNAGVPETGPWMVWDRADGGGELVFNGFTQSNLSEFGYQPGSAICITQANHDHTLGEAEKMAARGW